MREIRVAQLDTARPVLVLTREHMLPVIKMITVAPIQTRAIGLRSEISVGRRNGLDHQGVVACDQMQTISRDELGRVLGFLLDSQERELADALSFAFELHG